MSPLRLPVLVVRGGDEAVVQGRAEVPLLSDMCPRDALGIRGVTDDHAGADLRDHLGACPIERGIRDRNVAREPAISILLQVPCIQEHDVPLGLRSRNLQQQGQLVLARLRLAPGPGQQLQSFDALARRVVEQPGQLLLGGHIAIMARHEAQIEEGEHGPRAIGRKLVPTPHDLGDDALPLLPLVFACMDLLDRLLDSTASRARASLNFQRSLVGSDDVLEDDLDALHGRGAPPGGRSVLHASGKLSGAELCHTV
mmetsp:Transcript_146892/g.409140  ORF Transcript_146892/g.409140 Transcript_146892/m.409140 type:complete len:255 (+) Transcript_146892:1331-2095(+)